VDGLKVFQRSPQEKYIHFPRYHLLHHGALSQLYPHQLRLSHGVSSIETGIMTLANVVKRMI
jgi:hypothetical protein